MGENPGRAYLWKFWNIVRCNKYHLLYLEYFYGCESTYDLYFVHGFRALIPYRSNYSWFFWYSER